MVERSIRVVIGVAAVAFGAGAPLRAQATTRLSVNATGQEGDFASRGECGSATTADRRFVVFESAADNLVSGDTNSNFDVFVVDRLTGTVELVSVDSSGNLANGGSMRAAISQDGRYVAFSSWASNLVPSDTNLVYDVFLRDRLKGTTSRVSVDSTGAQANGASDYPSISDDGRYVAFSSDATNLVANGGDTNGWTDVFRRDLSTSKTIRVSVDSAGNQGDSASWLPAISGDGSVVAFQSNADDLIRNDGNVASDIFVRDYNHFPATTERVSVDSSGAEANAGSESPSISSDGNVVAFDTYASNLVANDTNSATDVFVRDRGMGSTELISIATSGAPGNAKSRMNAADAVLSSDGRYVAFSSVASDLIASDTNGVEDVFRRDRSQATTIRASVGAWGNEGDDASTPAGLSRDGQLVVFWSYADNLVSGDANYCTDLFVRDLFPATWVNYGNGWAGTDGVPSFSARTNPVLGSTLTLDLANSLGDTATNALEFLGYARADLHSSWGGDLLVLPALVLPFPLPANGTTLVGTLPNDPRFSGFEIDLQCLEADAGATKGVSFTPGLALTLGY